MILLQHVADTQHEVHKITSSGTFSQCDLVLTILKSTRFFARSLANTSLNLLWSMPLSPTDGQAEFIDPHKILPSTLYSLHDLRQHAMNTVNSKIRKGSAFAKLLLLALFLKLPLLVAFNSYTGVYCLHHSLLSTFKSDENKSFSIYFLKAASVTNQINCLKTPANANLSWK